MSFWNETILPALEGVFADIIGILPNLFGALTIFVMGWIVASLLRRFISRLLDKVGFNGIVEKAGITSFLHKAGYAKPASSIIGQLIFWMVLLTFILSAAESLQMHAVANILQQFVAFIPKLIAVAFLLVLGIMLARFVGGMVQGAAAESGIEFADLIGKIVSNLIVISVAVIAISQLEIESGILNILFGVLLGAFGLAIALTLGLGTRTISQNIISGVYARRGFQVGQKVTVGDISGEIREIGTVNTVIKSKKGLVAVPNTCMIEDFTTIEAE